MLTRGAGRTILQHSRKGVPLAVAPVVWARRAIFKSKIVASAPLGGVFAKLSGVPASGQRFMSTDKPSDGAKAEEVKVEDVPEGEEREPAWKNAVGSEAEPVTPKEDGPKVYAGEHEVGDKEGFEFRAETRQLLDIVANSLYQDKEVFIRELISNASDALEKARYSSLAQGGQQISEDLEVKIVIDKDAKLFSVQDNGIGMTGEELRENLGTIAKSGSKQFIKEVKEGANQTDAAKNIIGKFGVGFYSSFMVAEEVKVFSKKRGDTQGHCWSMSKHDGTFTIAKAENVEPGTKIVLKLRDECLDYTDVKKVREIAMRFSTFVAFPLTINGSNVNDVKALWLEDASKVTEEEHSALFKHIAGTWEDPMYTIMYKADAPIDIKSVFYIPRKSDEQFGQVRYEIGVHLYSRRVLIQKHAKDLLPEYLRFIKGVVDSEDLPLSISRETMQDKALLSKLKTVLTKRCIRWMIEESKKDPAKFKTFYDNYGIYIKEGVSMDQANSKDLIKLLRYSSSAIENDEMVSLQDYVDRMKPDQDSIYYLISSDRKSALASPYYEAFKRAGIEVLFCYAMHDEIVMGNSNKVADKDLKSIEIAEPPGVDNVEESKEEDKKESQSEGSDQAASSKKKLSTAEAEELLVWFRIEMDSRMSGIDTTNRLVGSPAIISDHDSAVTRRMMQMEEFKNLGITRPSGYKLLINPSHPLIIELHAVRHKRPGVAKLVAEQILDNALVAAGILENVQAMMPRLNKILKSALADDDYPIPEMPEVEQAEDIKKQEEKGEGLFTVEHVGKEGESKDTEVK